MKKKSVVSLLVLALAALVAFWVAGCTEEELIDIALAFEFPVEQSQNSADQIWQTTTVIDLAAEVEKALEGTDYSREDITKAVLNGASYEVTEFEHDHDWTIGGKLTVARTDPGNAIPATDLFDYSNGVSVAQSLNNKTVVNLQPAGVGVINAALEDFVLDTSSTPVLQFVTGNETVTPPPSDTDRIVFKWTVWIRYQIVSPRAFEKFDPLP